MQQYIIDHRFQAIQKIYANQIYRKCEDNVKHNVLVYKQTDTVNAKSQQ